MALTVSKFVIGLWSHSKTVSIWIHGTKFWKRRLRGFEGVQNGNICTIDVLCSITVAHTYSKSLADYSLKMPKSRDVDGFRPQNVTHEENDFPLCKMTFDSLTPRHRAANIFWKSFTVTHEHGRFPAGHNSQTSEGGDINSFTPQIVTRGIGIAE